jgi:ribosome maturation factor RimP
VRVEIGTPVDGRKRFHGNIAGEEDGAALLKLKDGGEAKIPLNEMVKAHLVLTDALIAAARGKGQAREIDDSGIEDGFDDVEVEDTEQDIGQDGDEQVSASHKRK